MRKTPGVTPMLCFLLTLLNPGQFTRMCTAYPMSSIRDNVSVLQYRFFVQRKFRHSYYHFTWMHSSIYCFTNRYHVFLRFCLKKPKLGHLQINIWNSSYIVQSNMKRVSVSKNIHWEIWLAIGWSTQSSCIEYKNPSVNCILWEN